MKIQGIWDVIGEGKKPFWTDASHMNDVLNPIANPLERGWEGFQATSTETIKADASAVYLTQYTGTDRVDTLNGFRTVDNIGYFEVWTDLDDEEPELLFSGGNLDEAFLEFHKHYLAAKLAEAREAWKEHQEDLED